MRIGNTMAGLHIDTLNPSTERAFLNGAATKKVAAAMTDDYIEKIREYARQDAASGKYMNEGKSGYVAMRNAQQEKFVSPSREKAMSLVSGQFKNVIKAMKSGRSILDLFGLNGYKAVYQKGTLNRSAEIYDESGTMIACYNEGSNGTGWTKVPTKDETQFGYQSNQIYMEAYQAARAEIEAAAKAGSNAAAAPQGTDTSHLNVTV